jgi:hypothetical protein
MSQSSKCSDENIIGVFQAHGGSWSEYILIGTPPSAFRWSPDKGLSALLIEDDALARATVEFLRLRSAKSFSSLEEFKQASGWDGSGKIHREK